MRGKEDPYLKVTEVNDRTKAREETGKLKPENGKKPNLSPFTPHPSPDYVWAVKDINLEVKQGEVLGIIGRNGAGKSTLLKILSRITAPTTGRIKIRGRTASLLEVGTGFHPELTGRENIYLNGAIMGMTKAEVTSKLDEIVDFSGCERYIDTPVKRYSSGMMVRLGFAVAAHLEPEILVVDEVLAVGDAEFQKKCLGKMKDVAGHGRTVLFVSHNMAAVMNLCHSGVTLEEGKIKDIGPASEVVDQYLKAIVPHTGDLNVDYIARNADLDVTLKTFSLLDARGHAVSAIQCGGTGILSLCLETATKQRKLLVSIAVNTVQDSRVCVFHSVISGFEGKVIAPKTTVQCVIPRVPFLPGTYRLSIKVSVEENVAFHLPSAAEITVVGGDFYCTGRLPEKAWGGVCAVDHSWHLHPAPIRGLE